MRWPALLLLLLCGVFPAGLLAAQAAPAVTGVVRDSAGRPIAGVEVRNAAARAVYSDSAGRFRITAAASDPVRLRLRKVGFEPLEVVTAPASATEAAPLMIVLGPIIARLGRVIVEGEAYDQSLWDSGFYRRQRSGRGTFLDSAEVAHYAPAGWGSLLQSEPMIRVERRGSQEFALSKLAGRACFMHVYVDGRYQREAMPDPVFGPSNTLGLRDIVDPATIRAMEVYPTVASVPQEFSRMGSASDRSGSRIPSPGRPMQSPRPSMGANSPCGAIVIWTRSHRTRQQDTARP